MANLNNLARAVLPGAAASFGALRHRNYRLWFFGQMVSLAGTWMQSVAQGWLVYELALQSDPHWARFALGAVPFLGSLPTIFLMIPAGALADRLPKRTILLVTQTVMMLQALALAALTFLGIAQVWHVGLLAFTLGIANSFDAPTRQSLAVEMVEDRRDLASAIAMNSLMFNVARILGPSLGGIVLAFLGASWCFFLNGVTFIAVLVALLLMHFPPGQKRLQAEPFFRQVRVGLHYIRRHVTVRTVILLVGFSSLFGFFHAFLLPAFARDILQVGETGLGGLQTAIGVGAITGSLTVAMLGRSRYQGIILTIGSIIFPLATILFAFSRLFWLSLVGLYLAGFGFVAQNASSNTLVQSIVPDELRGRVMGVYTAMFFGTTPFCSLLAGILAQALDPSWAILIGSGLTLLFALGLAAAVPALRRPDAVPQSPHPLHDAWGREHGGGQAGCRPRTAE